MPLSAYLWALPPVVLAAVAYHPILQSFFYADDFLNFYWISNRPLFDYLVTPHGGHLLLTRNSVFYLTHALFGLSPEYYFASVLVTHLLNVCLLFAVIARMCGRPLLASFGAAIWGVSPLHEGTLGWYSVYGQALATTFLLVILYQAQSVAGADRQPSKLRQALWGVLAAGAATSFGTGLAAALVLPWVLLLLIPDWPGRAWWKPPLWFLVVLLVNAYAASNWPIFPESDDSVVTQAAWSALQSPAVILQTFARVGAYGFTQLCVGLWGSVMHQPIVYYAALVAFLVGILWAYVVSAAPVRRWLAASSLLLVSCYGSIAAARGGLSLLKNLDMITMASRYHYIGQLLWTLLLCLFLKLVVDRLGRRVGNGLLAAFYASVAISCVLFPPAIDHHSEARDGTEAALSRLEKEIRSQPADETVVLRNEFFRPVFQPPTVFPGLAAFFVSVFPDNTVAGRPVRFIESNPAVIEATKTGRRTADLFVFEPSRGGKNRPRRPTTPAGSNS